MKLVASDDSTLLEDGMALSATEADYLGKMLNAGDRGGFYATYNAVSYNLGRSMLEQTDASGALELPCKQKWLPSATTSVQ